MARRGRPRKAGKRKPCGRLAFEPAFDKGSEWVQARIARFGTHYSTALGRAYAAGLLADDEERALDLYQAGKRFARLYNRIIGGETYRCALDRSPRGNSDDDSGNEWDQHDHDWLFEAMIIIDKAGCRPYFDQLIARSHTDVGPCWLDRLLVGETDHRDKMLLSAAITALELIAPKPTPAVIRAAQYGQLDCSSV